jgi:hypothetical protein
MRCLEALRTDIRGSANRRPAYRHRLDRNIADAYKGGRLKIIGVNAQRPPYFIIVQPEIKYSGSGSSKS